IKALCLCAAPPRAMTVAARTRGAYRILNASRIGACKACKNGESVSCEQNPGMEAFSVIVPLYNEEESVTPLYVSLIAALEPLERSFEILLVDDGSRDGTFTRAATLARRDGRVRVIKF